MKMTKNMSVLAVIDLRDPDQIANNAETPLFRLVAFIYLLNVLFRAQFDQSAVTCLFSTLDEKVTVGNENGLLVQYDISNTKGNEPLCENESTHRVCRHHFII